MSLVAVPATAPDELARAARALGRRGEKRAQQPLVALLARPEMHVRLAAAEALAHCGSTNVVPALLAALTDDGDQFLEHALTYTLHRWADTRALLAALDHPHPRAQKAALTLLDQAPHHALNAGAVLKRVFASDEPLRRTARRILQQHTDWAPHGVAMARQLLTNATPTASERGTLRELILAFPGDGMMQTLVADAAANTNHPASRREFLLETMAFTTITPFPDSWVAALVKALSSGEPAVRLQAARAAGTRKVPGLEATLANLVEQTGLAPELRLEALRSTLARRPQLTRAAFDFLLAQLGPASAPGSRLAAAELLGRARWADAENDPARLVPLVLGDRLIAPSSLLPLLVRSEGTGVRAAWSYVAEAVEQGWQPSAREMELLARLVPAGADAELRKLTALVAQRTAAQREQIDAYIELLSGGDAQRGRRWFSEKTGCNACHRVGAEGGLLGPDLTRIGAIRSGRDLIESIVLPSATFAQGYDTFTVTLRDGEDLTGIRVRQPDDSFVLRDAAGETRLDASQIKRTERRPLSLMPEGLLHNLTHDEIRDLLAYLQSLK